MLTFAHRPPAATFRPPPAPVRPATLLPASLRRRCACGGVVGPDGECATCRAQHLAAQSWSAGGGPGPALPAVAAVLGGDGDGGVQDAGRLDQMVTALPARSRAGHDFARVGVQPMSGEAAAGTVDHARDRVPDAEASVPVLARSGIALRRQAAPADDTAQQAARADLLCDIPALCRLRASDAATVSEERIRSVAARCRPGTLVLGNPCLMPQFMLPPPAAAPPGPTTPGPAPGGAPSPGLNLGGLTSFRFNLGPARLAVELPATAKATLPVALSGARAIEFSLDASPSAFSFAARLDGVSHVRIAARAGVDVSGQTASAGLTVTTTRTVCRAAEPETARREITDAGARLARAINDWQNPPPPAPGATPPATTDRLVAIGSELGTLYGAVERVKRPCEQRPVATFGLGTQVPFGPGPEPSETPRATTAGATLTFHF